MAHQLAYLFALRPGTRVIAKVECFFLMTGFLDLSDEYDTLLHNIGDRPILRKLKHPPPPLEIVEPMFHFLFDKTLHGE
jgi:hypothetical protein